MTHLLRPQRRRFASIAFAIALAATASLTVLATVADAATQYRVTGRGWGHGIGMSQYGAQGFALRGYTAAQIVAWYYQGTAIGTAPADAANFRVLLVGGRSAVSFGIDADGAQVAHDGDPLAAPLARGDVVTARVENGLTSIYRRRDGVEAKLFGPDAAQSTISGPDGAIETLFRADNGASNHHYRGSVSIVNTAGRLSAINTVPFESYLRGVVPAEMPTSWQPAALQAQAIAARSYAIAQRRTGAYDAYADTRSQVYRGIEEEEPPTDAAVAATAGQVLTFQGAVIPAFFFSTSGGQTANNEDVWPGAPRAYLRSRPDPYEVSPYSRWTKPLVYTPRQLKRKLGGYVSGALLDVRVELNRSRRVRAVRVVGSNGTNTAPASSFQVRLGLRSTWFRVEKLSIAPRVARPRAGSRFRLVGTIPSGGATYVQYRDSRTRTWTRIARVRPRRAGAWQLRVGVPRGVRTRDFRLERAGIPGPAVRVRPRLR